MNVQPAAIADLLDRGFHSPAFQPICRLVTQQIVGFEALMRGPQGTELAEPAIVFQSAAADHDLLLRLDIACLLSAVSLGRVLPDDVLLFVNVRGETLIDLAGGRREVESLLDQLQIDVRRIVLEISELTDDSYVRSITRSLKPLRSAGMRVALDDVGARYAWLKHMLWIEPDILKVDRYFVHRIDCSPRKRNLIASFVRFCADTGAEMIAEGIETTAEHAALVEAGVPLGQGYLLGRPQAIQAWMPPGDETATRARVSALVTAGGPNA
jgi:EAL domain-containing protein (putative c-di-GMP-specific phosphodiesterase class I)